jgi:hypothetical protein
MTQELQIETKLEPVWPEWARPQLARAVDLATSTSADASTAMRLYREWFNPSISGELTRLYSRRPIAGTCRTAHAGNDVRTSVDGIVVVDRHDVVGSDGWWRTWGRQWTPPRTRRGSVRVLFTPYAGGLGAFVRTVTGALLDSADSWSLAVAINPRRARRWAGAVLDLPNADALPPGLLDALAPTLRPVVPPLCLPLSPGAGLAAYPENGMTFGEHRCHLIALALRRCPPGDDPLTAIGRVFEAHGISPAAPYK